MKALVRSPAVTALLGFVIWAWMALIGRTIRWRVEGAEAARAILARTNGACIFACWHETILLMPSGWNREIRHWPERRGRTAMMISLSPDGEPVARAVQHLDLDVVRGSARNKRKADKDKGGAKAIAEASRRLREGGIICMTPDGPRGPRRTASAGSVTLAQRAGVGVLPYAVAARPVWRLKTWDRFIIPWPFTQGAIVFGQMIDCPREAATEDLQARLQAGMDAATARAEALAARTVPRASGAHA